MFDTKTLSDNDKRIKQILSQYTRASTKRKVQHRKNLDKSSKPLGTSLNEIKLTNTSK